MRTRSALVLAMVLALVFTGVVNAQGPSGLTYSSSFQLQNLSGATANVVLTYYNQDGSTAASKSYTIDPNSNRTFVQLTDVTSGFNGSLVVSSDQDLRAINNLAATGGTSNYFESTNGFQSGATTVNLPLIMCNNSGFNTWFNIQNAGTAAATNVRVSYTPGLNGKAGSEGPFTIQPGAAKTLNQAEGSATLNCASLKDASGRFVGSAIVTADQPVAVVVMEVGTGGYKAMMGYGGFGAGSRQVVLPLLMGNNNSFYTSVQIMNTSPAGTAAASISLAYSPNTFGTFQPAAETFTLAPGASKTIFQNANRPANGSSSNDWVGKGRYVGSGTITAPAGTTIVAIVNQNGGTSMGSGYSGVDPATGTNRISMPLLMGNNSTFYTSVQIMNTSPAGSPNATVTLTYSANTAGTFNPAAETFSLAPGSSKTIFQNAGMPANGSTVNDWTGKGRYVGSGIVSAPAGTSIVAIVNQQSGLTGDQLATNNAFNIAP